MLDTSKYKSKVIEAKGDYHFLTSENIKFVHRIGVELEGGWLNGKPENTHEDASLQGLEAIDGGVRISSDHNCHVCQPHNFLPKACKEKGVDWCLNQNHKHCSDGCTNKDHCDSGCTKLCACPRQQFVKGECISKPSTIEELRSWIEINTPDTINTNCGLHVHISVNKPADYLKLATMEFYNYFLDWFNEWGRSMGFDRKHEFWSRLRGDNRYCLKEFRADEQMKLLSKEDDDGRGRRDIRRTQLNYCYNFQSVDENGKITQRKTLECRLFPAFKDPGKVMAAVESFVRCVETYLAKAGEVEDKPVVKRAYLDNKQNIITWGEF